MRRGSLSYDKGEDGRVYVYLPVSEDAGQDEPKTPSGDLVADLRDQVAYLREQLAAEREVNRENRRLLAAALERIPQIEPADHHKPSEEGARSGAENAEGVTPRPDDAEAHSGSQEQRREPESRLGRWLRGLRR